MFARQALVCGPVAFHMPNFLLTGISLSVIFAAEQHSAAGIAASVELQRPFGRQKLWPSAGMNGLGHFGKNSAHNLCAQYLESAVVSK
jgi:hypothetical protein